LFLASAAAIMTMVGCGGGGDSIHQYVGVWTPEVSEGSLTITSDGHMSMAIADETIGGTDTYNCHISSNGDFHGTMTNPNASGSLDADGYVDRVSSDELFVHIRLRDPDTGDTSTAEETFFRSGSAHGTAARPSTGLSLGKAWPKKP